MNIFDFFNYRNNCPICNKELFKGAQISIIADNQKGSSHAAGYTFYKFNGKRFCKSAEQFSDKGSILVSNFLTKTFTINKKFNIRFNRNNLSNLVKPLFITGVDARLYRACEEKNHVYYYEAENLFEKELCDNIKIADECINIYNIMITNHLNKESPYSNISYPNYQGDDLIFSNTYKKTLPLIPITKWDTSSKKALKNQIDKYMILK
jgi:hypothetical protein